MVFLVYAVLRRMSIHFPNFAVARTGNFCAFDFSSTVFHNPKCIVKTFPSMRESHAANHRGRFKGEFVSHGKILSEKWLASRAFYFLDNVGGFVVYDESAQIVDIQQLTSAGAPTQTLCYQVLTLAVFCLTFSES